MPEEPTEREKELARRVAELETQLGRPKLSGGGVIADTANLILVKVPKHALRIAAYLVLTYMGVSFFFEGRQILADTDKMQAEVATKTAKVEAAKLQGETLKAEIERTQAEAAQARAEATAQGTLIGDKTVRLRTLQADTASAQAEADKVGAQLDAMAQIVNGTTPLAIEQRRAEVKKIEADADSALAFGRSLISFERQR